MDTVEAHSTSVWWSHMSTFDQQNSRSKPHSHPQQPLPCTFCMVPFLHFSILPVPSLLYLHVLLDDVIVVTISHDLDPAEAVPH